METLSQVQQDENNESTASSGASSSGGKPKSLIKTTQDRIRTFHTNAKVFLKALKSINSKF
jgi:hypothetical protein